MAAPTSALSTDDAFWADADRHLIRYAGASAFTREVIDHAAGSFLFTEAGRQILDFTSGQMSAILGHSHPEIAPPSRGRRPSSTTCSAACSAAPSST
jgi:2,2-dialkylglycine decarboxylase (pyruvate)